MNSCISCGTSFAGYGSTCGSCRTQETIKNENQKNRQQTEYLNRQNELIAQREMHIQREMIERNAIEQRMFAAQQQQFAQEQIELENLKLIELQKQTRLIEEQSISVQEAYEAGYNIHSIISNYLENCSIGFKVNNPYITSKLNTAYLEGVNKKISTVFTHESIWIEKLTLAVKNSAREKRMQIIDTEEKNFTGEVDLFIDPIALVFDSLTIDFGIISTKIRVEVTHHTGELKILDYSTSLTSNILISNIFENTFDLEGILNIVNQKHRRLIRLESILSTQVDGYTFFIEDQKNNNQKIKSKNLKTKIVYLIIALGFFAPPFLWIYAYYIADGQWKLIQGYNIKNGYKSLKILRDFLDETKRQLKNPNLDDQNDSFIFAKSDLLFGAQWCMKRDLKII